MELVVDSILTQWYVALLDYPYRSNGKQFRNAQLRIGGVVNNILQNASHKRASRYRLRNCFVVKGIRTLQPNRRLPPGSID